MRSTADLLAEFGKMRLHALISAIIAVGQFVGCASIVTGQNQSVSVETRTDTALLEGAQCKLSNDKGTWYVVSPGSTVVQRSYQDLDVRCERESHDPGIASAKSSTNAMVACNVHDHFLLNVIRAATR